MTKTTPTPQPESPQQPQESWLAIASVILGVMSLTGFGLLTGIPAIVTGAIALVKKQAGRNMSIAGIIMGGIGTLLSVLLILFAIVLIATGIDAAGNVPEFHPEELMPSPQEWMESSQT